MRQKGCTEPEVQKCLHCKKPDCDAPLKIAPHISEIYALVRAGMAAPQAIAAHHNNKGRRFGAAVKAQKGVIFKT